MGGRTILLLLLLLLFAALRLRLLLLLLLTTPPLLRLQFIPTPGTTPGTHSLDKTSRVPTFIGLGQPRISSVMTSGSMVSSSLSMLFSLAMPGPVRHLYLQHDNECACTECKHMYSC